jgi:hypothetical protein
MEPVRINKGIKTNLGHYAAKKQGTKQQFVVTPVVNFELSKSKGHKK